MWLPSEQVGMLVDRGSDFANLNFQEQLDHYGCFVYRDTPERMTTHVCLFLSLSNFSLKCRQGVNIYKGLNFRDFDYLTPKKLVYPIDLKDTRLFRSQAVHFISSSDRALEILDQLDQLEWPTITCYEPVPAAISPSAVETLKKVLLRIDIFSPNHEEAAAYFEEKPQDWTASKEEIEILARKFVELGAKTVVIRSGSLGACAVTRGQKNVIWVPAYQQNQSKVIDPTGCGNSFLVSL